MDMSLFADFLGQVRADGDNSDPAPIKLGTQFLQPPQLGDTVGSPVGAEEFDEDRVAA